MEQQPAQRREYATRVAVCYLALLLATLLTCIVLMITAHHTSSDIQDVATLSTLWALNNLFALACVAPRNNWRAWFMLSMPIVSPLTATGLQFGMTFQVDLDETVFFSAVYLATAVVVIVVLGPWRLRQSFRQRQLDERTDWRFGIRHFLIASILVALAASVVHFFADELSTVVWSEMAIHIANAAAVTIICGLLLQAKPLGWRRLATAVGLALAVGWCCNQIDSEFARYGGVRANAIQLAVTVPWLWATHLVASAD